MILSENCHTPVSFWLKLPLSQLPLWIQDNNAIIRERIAERDRQRKRR